MLTLASLFEARDVIHRFLPETPEYNWPLLDEALGAEVWVKHENHAPTGSFKIRSALAYIYAQSLLQPPHTTYISATSGNFGLSIAYAAQKFNYGSVAVVPVGSPLSKKAYMQAMGCFVIEHGENYNEAEAHAVTLSEEQGFQLVPSFHHELVCGAATYALAFFKAQPKLDVVYVPVGLGTSICGVIAARDLLHLSTKVVGVVGQCSQYQSNGHSTHPLETHSFADGIAISMPHKEAEAIIGRGAERIIQVSDIEIADAIRLAYGATHNLLEGAGAAGLAGMIKERNMLQKSRIGTIFCGQNIDRHNMALILQGLTP
ncbi:threonine dehydratase [Polycladidibacter stylochi]|uniref:threonine dehydratase n=1 Tax=Polycladidibacter stylochi TaxID=1807766 RepID=UPI00082B562D|nr:threonine dehydratase [Pseudovibrio stylochi]